MRVLITGGAGYIGTSLVNDLLKLGIEDIVVYDNLSRPNNGLFLGSTLDAERVQFVKGDILDTRRLGKTLEGIDLVYHLAARVSTPFSDFGPHAFEQINNWGTAELVYACERAGIPRVVYVSSASVYGHRDELIDDSSIPNADSSYGLSKLRGEEHVNRDSSVRSHVIRLGNVYGYNHSMRFDAVINRFLFDAHFLSRITVIGDGEQMRSFIHVDKVSQTLAKLAVTDVPIGTFNLSDRNLSVMDIVNAFLEIDPALEFSLVGQHQRLKGHTIRVDDRLRSMIPLPETDFVHELKAAQQKFAF